MVKVDDFAKTVESFRTAQKTYEEQRAELLEEINNSNSNILVGDKYVMELTGHQRMIVDKQNLIDELGEEKFNSLKNPINVETFELTDLRSGETV